MIYPKPLTGCDCRSLRGGYSDTDVSPKETFSRLSLSNLPLLRSGVAKPGYDPRASEIGIVHFGPGSFFRSHTAWHIDRLLPHDPRWGISAISLRSGRLAKSLAEQDFLYTLAELDVETHYRIIGSIREYLVAVDNPDAVFQRLMQPSVGLVTITITEKGYCLDGDGELDLGHPDIVRDLQAESAPVSVIGWLVEGLARRRATGIAPFVVMSCDNLAQNGPKLRGATMRFARAKGDNDLANWLENDVRFPATMVDSITPHSDASLKERVADGIGLHDEAPVEREHFTQWVIEDIVGDSGPNLASVGAILTRDVAIYELAKLRLLNGAHSALAYLGIPAGHETIGEAMRDGSIARFVERMMREDVARTLPKSAELDVSSYIDVILNRFQNPAVKHKLRQIAADGSLKIPYRFLDPIVESLSAGGRIDRLVVPVAAWLRFVVNEGKSGRELDDPMEAVLAEIARKAPDDAQNDVALFLSLRRVFPVRLSDDGRFISALKAAYANLVSGEVLPE